MVEFWLSLLAVGVIGALVYGVGFIHGVSWYYRKLDGVMPEPIEEDAV